MGQYWSRPTRHGSLTFVSLGMIVLDELHFPQDESLYDVPGGSGLYATFGARAMESAYASFHVGAIVLAGHDFPESLLQTIHSWKLTLLVRRLTNQPTTRGLLEYRDNHFGSKSFRYVTPKLQPQPSDLRDSYLLGSRSFHFLANPQTLEEQVLSLLSLRRSQGENSRPLIVWEPAPLDCKRKHFEQHLQACKIVDIFSPNHLELTSLVQDNGDESHPFSRDTIERYAKIFVESGIGTQNKGLAVIRCGEHGCLTLSQDLKASWLPAFYDSQSPRLVDTTGAGNAFLGAFTVGWAKTKDSRQAAIMGSVAASFAIEQPGPPVFTPATWVSGEKWNNEATVARVEEFKRKLSRS